MSVKAIPVDQRLIDIDSRRFSSIEKALVELLTNSDDSYLRLERAGEQKDGRIVVCYERHRRGALLTVTDQAEGMSFDKVRFILRYGGAHSLLAQGVVGGRGYFGRGLKQAVFGLGYGWLETIHQGRLSRIDLFRSDSGEYLYDDGGEDRAATAPDRERLGLPGNGTRVTIVIDNPQVKITRFASLVESLPDNFYLRDILLRRHIELVHLKEGREIERSGAIRFVEPESVLLLGPDAVGQFQYENDIYPFTVTLKRALGVELVHRGDERTAGLTVVSGAAVLDCQLFDYENQVGTEYLFGTVSCPALLEKLGEGVAVISDERAGLNPKAPFVAAFYKAVSKMIAPHVMAEKEKLKHLEHATTSSRTAQMIEHILLRMNHAAIHDFGIMLPATTTVASDKPDKSDGAAEPALRFSTGFYYRKPNHAFPVRLLVDPERFEQNAILSVEASRTEGLEISPLHREMAIRDLRDEPQLEWTVRGRSVEDHGEIVARVGNYFAWCDIVIAEHASAHHHQHHHAHAASHVRSQHRSSRDQGEAVFTGYEFRYLGNETDRAVYSPEERKILINTAAPTVQLYLDGRGNFRDSARLLLAELFMDVIAKELARHRLAKSARKDDVEAFQKIKREIVRRYGSDIHLSFLKN
ncbi:hypothetical protein GCM10027343_31930 [Noviherbaspirillum agri]